MRILIVNKFLYPNGGSETYIFRIGEQLAAMGHEVQYFGMEHEGRCVGNAVGSYTAEMDFHGGSALSKVSYPLKTIYSAEARRKIRLVLDDFRPEVVHLNNFTYQLTPSIILEIRRWEKEAGQPCRIVFTAHDYNLVCPNHLLNNLNCHENCERCLGGHYLNCVKGKCIHGSTARSAIGAAEAMFWNANGVYRQIDAVICCSAFMQEKMNTNPVFAGKTLVMHNFVNVQDRELSGQNTTAHPTVSVSVGVADSDAASVEERRENSAAGGQSAACPDPADGGRDRIGRADDHERQARQSNISTDSDKTGDQTGEGSEEKTGEANGRYVLYFGRYTKEKGVATLLEACRQLPEIPFVFAGKGKLEDEVNAAANVRNVGFLGGEELNGWIHGATFTVFPSEWMENGPFTVIESIVNGTPILASNLGGTPEMIAEGQTGELFEAGNAAELAERIRDLYEDETRLARYRENCLETAAGGGPIPFDSLETYCRRLVEDVYRV